MLYAILSGTLFWLFWAIDPFYLTVPTDSELIEKLNSHHEEFDKLSAMIFSERVVLEDGSVVRLGKLYASDIDRLLPHQRKKEYQALISKIPGLIYMNIYVFDEDEKDYSVEFVFAISGTVAFLFNLYWRKGILYSNLDHGIALSDESLDVPSQIPEGRGGLRKISPSWYIFVSRNFKI